MFSVGAVGVLAALLLMTNGADAFFASSPTSRSHHQHCRQLFSFHQSYQHDLEQLSRMGYSEVTSGLVNKNAVTQKMDEDLQASQDETQEAEARLVSLKSEMESKITEQAQTIQALDIALQQQAIEAQKNWMTIDEQDAIVKLEADKEKTAVIAEFKAREEALQREMNTLAVKLAKEEDTVKVQREVSNNILANRIELDRELSLLKKQHATDIKEWESKLKAEENTNNRNLSQFQVDLDNAWLRKMGNKLSVRDKEAEAIKAEMKKVKNEMAEMKTEMAKMEAERNSARSLFMRFIKIAFRRRGRRIHQDTI